jgi:L-serine dehydratase
MLPDSYDADKAENTLTQNAATKTLTPDGLPDLAFDPKTDLIFDYDTPL